MGTIISRRALSSGERAESLVRALHIVTVLPLERKYHCTTPRPRMNNSYHSFNLFTVLFSVGLQRWPFHRTPLRQLLARRFRQRLFSLVPLFRRFTTHAPEPPLTTRLLIAWRTIYLEPDDVSR